MSQNISNHIRVAHVFGAGFSAFGFILAVIFNYSLAILAFTGGVTIFCILTIPKQVTYDNAGKYLLPFLSGVIILGSSWMYAQGLPALAGLMIVSAGVLLVSMTNRFTGQQLLSFLGIITIITGIWLMYSTDVLLGLVTILMAVMVFGQSIKETVANVTN